MNKKFSTLVATLFCAATLSVNAQTTMPIQNPGVLNVLSIDDTKYYQLASSNGEFVLVMEQIAGTSDFAVKLKSINTNDVDLESSLWKIEYTTTDAGTMFTYVNKKTGLPLSVDASKAIDLEKVTGAALTGETVKIGGSVAAWSWNGRAPFVPQGSTQALGAQGLTSYVKADSVLCLVTGANFNGTNTVSVNIPQFGPDGKPTGTTTSQNSNYNYTTSENVYLVRVHKDKQDWKKTQLRLAPVTPGSMVLSAKALNTMMGSDMNSTSFKLGATPELKVGENSALGNIFAETTFRAWNGNNSAAVVGKEGETSELYAQTDASIATPGAVYGDLSSITKDNGYVLLQVIDGTNDDKPYEDTYLTTDTADYIAGTSQNLKLVGFTNDKVVTMDNGSKKYFVNGVAKNRAIGSYMYKFEYHPIADSIAISVKSYMDKGDADATTGSKWQTLNTTNSLITLNKLTSTSEITILPAAGPANVRFFLGVGNDGRTSENNGVYVIKNEKGQFLAVPIYNTNEGLTAASAWDKAPKWVTVKGDEQAAMNMPAYQWVVVKDNERTDAMSAVSAVTVINREFADVKSSIQLYQKDGATYKYINKGLFNEDSLRFESVTEEAVKNQYLGYLHLDKEVLKVMSYKFNYLHKYADDKFIGMDGDSILFVLDNQLAFYMDEASAEENYGIKVDAALKVKKGLENLAQLKRVAYTPYAKTADGKLYITINDEGIYKMDKDDKQTFYLKENNCIAEKNNTPYYAFINKTDGNKAGEMTKVGSADEDLSVILKDIVLDEERTSAFAVLPNDAPLYRRFLTEEGKDEAQLLKFYEYYVNDYLMDETNEKFQREGVNYLGIGAEGIAAAGLSFKVRPYNIGKSAAYQIKPQYLVIVNESVNKGKEAVKCNESHKHYDVEAGEETTDPYKCFHAQKAVKGFDRYKMLVSFADSVETATAFVDQKYHYGTYSRVGFVDAVEQDSVLYILGDKFAGVSTEDLTIDAITEAGIAGIDMKADVKKDEHKNYTWSFRYITPEKVADATEENLDVAFLIESNVEPKGNATEAIAPMNAAWIRQQNNCLVLSDPKEAKFENAKTGGDAALIFNAEAGSEDDMATENEAIATSTISVIATDGGVIVKGAEGKNVVITNVLGQTIANTVVTSSEATISAPAGYVTVAVEGEAAVKAIVK